MPISLPTLPLSHRTSAPFLGLRPFCGRRPLPQTKAVTKTPLPRDLSGQDGELTRYDVGDKSLCCFAGGCGVCNQPCRFPLRPRGGVDRGGRSRCVAGIGALRQECPVLLWELIDSGLRGDRLFVSEVRTILFLYRQRRGRDGAKGPGETGVDGRSYSSNTMTFQERGK